MSSFHGRQLAAARALAELTIVQLAEAAGVTTRTVHRLEMGGEIAVAEKRRHGHVSRVVWEKIVDTFARHGVELTREAANNGAGVRWRLPQAERRAPDAMS